DDADDLAGLIGHYGLSKPIIIGFSMGSYITLTAAEKYSDLFSKIILIGTRGKGDSYPSERISEAKDQNEAAIIKALINFDLMSNIGNVKIPVLVITGENDAINPPAEGKKVADALSASKFEVIPNAPHVAFMNETERKIVFDVIDEFLAGTHERRD
ncbi:MAG: alpha/beta hydrolase, partial [Synergistaceae bacterium]|nr:alpha/beta hydrolase [Synergistaceae bacterium]